MSEQNKYIISTKLRQSVIIEMDLAFDGRLLCPGKQDYWLSYRVKNNEIWCRCNFFLGASGLEGDLGLHIPPKGHDSFDAWEGSRAAGEWDRWSFLRFMVCPASTSPGSEDRWSIGVNIIFFFGEQTFFDSPHSVVNVIHVGKEDSADLVHHYLYFNVEMEIENLQDSVKKFMDIIAKKLGARQITPNELREFQ